MVKCNSCGGQYEPVLSDGMEYFHKCPPLSVVELAAAVAAGKVVLPGGETPDVAVTRRTYERQNQRDENLVSTTIGAPVAIKAAGTGTTAVAPAPPPVVKVP
jgi:hypothetical protein